MSIFRRLSFIGGSSSSTSEEEPRPHRRHHHHLSRNQKNYDVSPTGGNRPISITADPRSCFPPVSSSAAPPRHHSSRHKSRSENTEAPPRRHRSRADATEDPARKHSSRSRRPRPAPEVPYVSAEPFLAELESPVEVAAPPSIPIPISMPPINMARRVSNSPTAGSSMGIVISGGRQRRGTDGSVSSTPMITATPPTPSPLEQARRANTHPTLTHPAPFFGGGAPPPYPVTPPESRQGEKYIAYAVSKMTVGTPEQDSLLHRYRSSFDPRVGRAELSSEPAPVEIGSSESIAQPPRRPSTDAPPAPTRTDSGKSFNSSSSPLTSRPSVRRKRYSLRENPYEFLRTFDTVFVIDDSASMDDFTRWSDTRAALETIATIATKYDSDGIDIHFLNSTQHDTRGVRSAAEIRRLFDLVQPGGVTPIAACLDRILRDYLDTYAVARPSFTSLPLSPISPGPAVKPQYPKPLNIIVLTDGEPTDDPESVIVHAARRLDELNAPLSQVGIQFFQIGDDEEAREALEELDDALVEIYGIRDMVDYTPYIGARSEEEGGEAVEGEWILKALMGAVNRKFDRWENDHGERR